MYATIVARDNLLNASSASTEVSATPWASLDVTIQPDYGRIATQTTERTAITSTTTNGGFGSALAIGDFDGDGDIDLAIGQPAAGGIGSVAVFDAMTGGSIATLLSGNPAEQYGAALAAGDFDGNGTMDLAIGEPAGTVGQVYLVEVTSSQQIARLDSLSVGGAFGRSVAVVGDFTGDGQVDLAVGEPGYNGGAGRVRQYDGATRTETDTVNGVSGDRFGEPVVAIGDLNGDGRGDWAAAATLAASGSGYVSLVSGGTAIELARINGAFAGSWFGQAITVTDGLIAVGAPGAATGALRPGGVAVFSTTDTTIVWAYWGDLDGARLGSALLWTDDLNGDGHADLLAGAPEAAPGATTQGAVYVLSGIDGRLLFRIDPDGSASGSRFGATLARIGDDIIIGAPDDDRGASGAGRVSLQKLRRLARQAFPTTSGTLAVTATPAVSQLEVRINGGPWQLTPISSTLAVTTPADGVHNVEARGVDSEGHRGSVTNTTVRIDLATPVTAWISWPVSATTVSGSTALTGAVTDATSSGSAGMLAAEWSLGLSTTTGWRWHNGYAVTAPEPFWFTRETTGPVGFTLPTTGPGQWQIRLRGRDGAWHAGPVTSVLYEQTP
ncbi:MAG: hypothetical protein D6761_13500 [Candidatus Dadabacteria bacterium]|nr:MAG: hypothetical protein D6761_13500 [Candidatus Dadabacteria bacterium]